MKRFAMTVVALSFGMTASAQIETYVGSYSSMLGVERAMNQGMLEYHNMMDARNAAKAQAQQKALDRQAQQEAMAAYNAKNSALRKSKVEKRREAIKEHAAKAKAKAAPKAAPAPPADALLARKPVK